MTHIDDRIRSALEAEDRELFDQLDSDVGLHELMFGAFRGKMRWMAALAMVYIFAFLGLGIYFGFKFYAAQEIKELMVWGGGTFACILFVMSLKLWFWMEMQKNAILREIKRVELQIFQLGNGQKA